MPRIRERIITQDMLISGKLKVTEESIFEGDVIFKGDGTDLAIGGTLDVSLLNINNGVFNVLATTGNSYLGGQDFNKLIFDYCITNFKKYNFNIKIEYKNYEKSLQKLRKQP